MFFMLSVKNSFYNTNKSRVEAARRAKAMIAKMDELGFGNCTNTGACEVECPKGVSIANIARLNREFLKAKLKD
jgi:succinate dehydrogenase / fumarate reductase iron-sulfur subunit